MLTTNSILFPNQLCDFEKVLALECTNGGHNFTELEHPICTKLVELRGSFVGRMGTSGF